jgi:hypothetical protein
VNLLLVESTTGYNVSMSQQYSAKDPFKSRDARREERDRIYQGWLKWKDEMTGADIALRFGISLGRLRAAVLAVEGGVKARGSRSIAAKTPSPLNSISS